MKGWAKCAGAALATSSGVWSSAFVAVAPHRAIRRGICRTEMAKGGGLGRRPVLSEDDLASPPDARVIDAVESVGGKSVVASDVATRAGVSLSKTRQSLSALAALTRGDMAVSPEGELLYTFPQNVRAALAANSARYRAMQTWEKAWPRLFYGIRVTFGLVLFVSIFAIFTTLIFVSQGASDRDDNRNDRRSRGYGGGNLMFDLLFPRNYFMYRPYYGYYSTVNPYQPYRRQQEQDEPNIFERVFAYIFGDGNPNRGLQAARLRAAARVIRQNGGAVVAEQLAPFLDVDSSPDLDADDAAAATYVDESFVLPIVSQLGGEPVVTEQGDIVYLFPELQISAESTLEAAGLPPDATASQVLSVLKQNAVPIPRGAVEKRDLIQLLERSVLAVEDSGDTLQEQELKFNRNGFGWNFLAGALGAINLGGALYLGQLLSSPAFAGYRLPAWYGFVQSAFPLLLIYALLFNVIPAVRYVYNNIQNAQIQQRNSNRRNWATYLQVAGTRMMQKLRSASTLRKNMKRISGSDAVFDTRRDWIERLVDKESIDMKEFDQRLSSGTKWQSRADDDDDDDDKNDKFFQ